MNSYCFECTVFYVVYLYYYQIIINSISSYIKNIQLLLYADDIKLFCKIETHADYPLLQEELDKFTLWASHLGLSLKISK